jgi:lipopolysaccharide export LptBFGC system permease protein LptF
LVVVLIAVPVGVTPGRRNVFYGVAGSIGLAFIYFVLQRVGFAMGQSGEVPGWAAAWIPNAVFAVSGAWMTSRIR